jgi:hypothetical protein
VTRLQTLQAWDTDGRLEKFARGVVDPEARAAAPPKGVFDESVRDAVRTGGKPKSASAVKSATVRTLRRACQ